MKFQNVQAFEKHLLASSVSAGYIIACSDPDERGKILSYVVHWLVKKYPSSEVVSFSGSEGPFSSVVETLSTRPLFSAHIIIKLDAASEFNKKEKEVLGGFIAKPSEFAFLVMGTSSLKDFASVLSSAKNELVVLDLTQEKPWDRQRRLQQWLMERCLKEGKKISQGVATELLDACGPDILLLEQELLKLIVFVGERPSISSDDIKKVGVNYVLPSGWQMAEALVWEGKSPIKDPSFSLSDLLPLLGQVRYHLTTARQFSYYVSQGLSREEISQHFPQVRQNSFEKYLQLSTSHQPAFFDEALKILFKIELLAKNSSLSAGFLWEYLVAQILQAKVTYAKKAPARSPS